MLCRAACDKLVRPAVSMDEHPPGSSCNGVLACHAGQLHGGPGTVVHSSPHTLDKNMIGTRGWTNLFTCS
jgi:hypothetical protein